jgi:hypothetical protein
MAHDTVTAYNTSAHLKSCQNLSCTHSGVLRCTRCSQASYCSKKCQKQDWKRRHQAACHNFRETEVRAMLLFSTWLKQHISQHWCKHTVHDASIEVNCHNWGRFVDLLNLSVDVECMSASTVSMIDFCSQMQCVLISDETLLSRSMNAFSINAVHNGSNFVHGNHCVTGMLHLGTMGDNILMRIRRNKQRLESGILIDIVIDNDQLREVTIASELCWNPLAGLTR